MEARKIEEHNLETFDDLDYNVFTGQKWNEFARSHHKDSSSIDRTDTSQGALKRTSTTSNRCSSTRPTHE
jgi:hypothetical protein